MTTWATILLCTFSWVGGANDQGSSGSPPPAAPAEVPVASQPYRIEMWLSFDSHPRFPETFRTSVRDEVVKLAHRLLGNAWQLQIIQPPSGLTLDRLPTPQSLAQRAHSADKILWLHVAAGRDHFDYGRSSIPIAAREFDFEFGQWSPKSTDEAVNGTTLGRSLFELAYRQFRPTAVFTGRATSKLIEAPLRGQALMPVGGPLSLAEIGTPFRIYREFLDKENKVTRTEIPWSYLIYRGPDPFGLLSRFDIVSGLRNPLAQRTRKRSRIIAIACDHSQDSQTTIRFLAGKENRPIVGFEVSARPQDQSIEVSIGNTDYEGRIEIRPIQLATERSLPRRARILEVSLLAGRSILARFPIVPGEQSELTVRARLDPLLTDLSGQILALQDEVVDVVARRSLLQRQLERHAEKKELDQAKQVATKINALPDKAKFEEKLEEIKTATSERAKTGNRPNLGPAIDRMFLQTDQLIQRYFQTDKVTVELADEAAASPDAADDSSKAGVDKTEKNADPPGTP